MDGSNPVAASTRTLGVLRGGEAVKHRFLHHLAIAKVLDDDSLEKRRRDAGVPDAFGIDDHDRPARAYTEAWSFATLHATRTEQQVFSLEQSREERDNLRKAEQQQFARQKLQSARRKSLTSVN